MPQTFCKVMFWQYLVLLLELDFGIEGRTNVQSSSVMGCVTAKDFNGLERSGGRFPHENRSFTAVDSPKQCYDMY